MGASLNGGFAGTPESPTERVNPNAATVQVAERFAAEAWSATDACMGEPGACQWFINWFDDTPRDEMRRELLAEVERALAEREPRAAA